MNNSLITKMSFLLAVLLMGLFSVSAQKDDKGFRGGDKFQEKNKKIEALKVSFFTTHMDLTPEESSKFWPVHNQYHKEQEELKQSFMKEFFENGKKIDDMSESELQTFVDKQIEMEEKRVAIRKKYHEKFLKILPLIKLARLYEAEKEFRKNLIRRLHEGERERPNRY